MKIRDDILRYRQMCEAENQETMQRGVNFRISPKYSVILMSQRSNAPYIDKVHEDGVTIEYEGHDINKSRVINPKNEDQPERLKSGRFTQNGLFAKSVLDFKSGKNPAELVKVYEKVLEGVWSLKGYFDLVDYKYVNSNGRKVFRFILKLSEREENSTSIKEKKLEHNRLIPSEVKKEVWIRDEGKCVLCGDSENLHFDHDLPFSKGGTSLSAVNIRLLCMKHNLQKSAKIE